MSNFKTFCELEINKFTEKLKRIKRENFNNDEFFIRECYSLSNEYINIIRNESLSRPNHGLLSDNFSLGLGYTSELNKLLENHVYSSL